jgi:hypothetical protein
MPQEMFEQSFGTEWYIRRDAGERKETGLFEGL